MIPPEMARWVRSRAKGLCEYCLSPETASHLRFHLDHIRAKAHGGESCFENLALACPDCNWHKSVNLTGIDPDSNEITPLFNPRCDVWSEHFEVTSGRIFAKTAKGRTTLWVLHMNETKQVKARSRQAKRPQ